MLNDREQLKKYLEENAKTVMKDDLNKSISEKDREMDDLNSNIIEALKLERNLPLLLDEPGNVKKFIEGRKDLNKKTYRFPDVLNLGKLISMQEIPSEIYKNNKFVHEIPFMIPIQKNGVAYLMNSKYKDVILNELETTVINLASAIPDGLVKFTLIDKTGSGQNFNALNRFNEKFVTGRVLSEDSEIREELETIKNSMGTISQAITANGFSSVEDYNNNTDEIPQRYNFIVINDFPSGFNKKATEDLFALIESGYKSGYYVFMTAQFDTITGFNKDINGLTLNSFLSLLTTFQYSDRTHIYKRDGLIQNNIEMLRVPLIGEDKFKSMVNSSFKIKFRNESVSDLDEKVDHLNKSIEKVSLKPMILLERLIPDEKEWYTKDASRGICVPFGKVGIENTYLNLGVNRDDEVENVHHGMICGMTGSGKTVLIHDLILMASIYYSPNELQFHLLDYKEGTEFALYKDFPQVNILSMDSEVEFGHDVLQNAVKEISRRGVLFKQQNVSNLKGYNAKVSEDEKLPRIIIFIDEFQELFPKDVRISSRSNELFDNILRRGRSFGVNLLVATQTLMGVDLEKQILSNMPLRIGLKMTEKDASKIFGENNIAAKYLTDPGEGIYNNSHGLARNNIPFQACNIEDDRIVKIINKLNAFMKKKLSTSQMDKLLESRFLYMGDLEGSLDKLKERKKGRIYIGEPIGLKKEHEFTELERDFGENLLLLGGDQVKAISILVNVLNQLQDHDISLCNFALSLNDLYKSELSHNKNISFFGNDDSDSELFKLHQEFLERFKNKTRNGKGKIFVLSVIESSKILNEAGSSKEKKILDELILSGPEYGIHVFIYALDHATLRDQDLIKHLSKFKKKITVNGGSSEKVLSVQVKGSKSNKIGIYEFGNDKPVKFKPYILKTIKTELNGDTDD